MSSDIAISVDNISKCYRIFENSQDRLKQSFFKKKKLYKEFWALSNVSFQVKRGDTIGLIGTNGSGKSTILQIIAGTLPSSSGEVKVNGRIAALLELGSGFNPEFTGRENVFLNGSIMGLSKEYIENRYDEILDFADIGDFIDQPVKTYSSGMYVRLAFAVAVHTDPDILIVDEALSVGDALFQHKCMARIKKMVNSGVTLFFVSHSPEAIRSLCKTGVWLENGKVKMIDDASKVSNAYLNEIFIEHNRLIMSDLLDEINENTNNSNEFDVKTTAENISNSDYLDVIGVRIKNHKGQITDSLEQGENFTVEIELVSKVTIKNFSVGIVIKDEYGIELTGESTFNKFKESFTAFQNQKVLISFNSDMVLRGGHSYSVNLRLNQVSKWDRSDNVHIYNDDTATVFKVLGSVENPMWFKFSQKFEVKINDR
jgi:lipopolysaccharide transport system ATP-binding protein